MSDRVLALAGVFQACAQVRAIATTGMTERDAFQASIASIFVVDPESALDCYGGRLENLQLGLDTLARELGGGLRSPEVLRYAFVLLQLERRLSRNRLMLTALREGIDAASRQASEFGVDDETVLARLDELYSATVSTLSPRVMVQGKPLFLQQARCVAEIRSLLLAGLRSAVLWAQLGGRRWHLLFTRGAVASTAQRLATQTG